jgi:glutathione S-transferase
VNSIVSNVNTQFLKPNLDAHYKFLEGQLATSPDGGEFLCGSSLTAADIMMSFPLEAGSSRSGASKESFPRVYKYLNRLHEFDGYKRANQKIEEVEGHVKGNL